MLATFDVLALDRGARDPDRRGFRSDSLLLAAMLALLLAPWVACRGETGFEQANLVSSVAGVAPITDPNLKNPWGISFGPTSPFWISNQVTGTATVYDGTGQPFPAASPRVVTIPTIGGISPSGPTGQVFNATSSFELAPGQPAQFLFSTLQGTIAGWNPTVNPSTALIMFISASDAAYTGLAIGNNGSGNFLYAANSTGASIDVLNAEFKQTTLGGSFTDPNLPAGFTPYNIQNLGGTLYVTYENETSGGGIVDAFDQNGSFLRRIGSNGAGGALDDPWGLALAPASFGAFGGALLVGNEGDGRISAFDPTTGQFLGQLLDAQGNAIANPGLWGLTFGNGGLGGDPNVLYFTAGIDGEREGLFGAIAALPGTVPEPASALLAGVAALAALAARRRVATPAGADSRSRDPARKASPRRPSGAARRPCS